MARIVLEVDNGGSMAFHVTIARDGRWNLFGTDQGKRAAVRAVCRCYDQALLLYCVVDDHLHAVVQGSRSEVGRSTAALQHILRRKLTPDGVDGPFTEPARVRPVRSRGHLEYLVGYVLRQPVHHGLGVPPARWPGSCFQDLVFARTVRGFDVHAIRRELPRLTDADIWAAAGLHPLAPLPPDRLEHFAARDVVRAAANVYYTSTELRGRTPEAVAARWLALGLLRSAGHPTANAARAVGCSARTARTHRQPHERAVEAALLQLAITTAVPEST